MSIDQREPGGQIAHRERRSFQSILESPFPNGSLIINGRDTGWKIRNDGVLVTFTQHTKNVSDPPFAIGGDIEGMTSYPIFRNIFGYNRGMVGSNPSSYPFCRVPALGTLNEFSEVVLEGLPIAGIQIAQTSPQQENEHGEAPFGLYVDNLVGKNPGGKRKLVASSQPAAHFHDMFAHWLGGTITEEREFSVYENLEDQTASIRKDFGIEIADSYRARLGLAFDAFSGLGTQASDTTLPAVCWNILNMDYTHLIGNVMAPRLSHEVLDPSRHIVEKYQQDQSTADGTSRLLYYAEINRRLQQAPWTPADYDLVLP